MTYNGKQYYFNDKGYLVTGEHRRFKLFLLAKWCYVCSEVLLKMPKGQSLVYGKSGKLTTQTGWKEVTVKGMIVVRKRNSTNTSSKVASWLLVLTEVEGKEKYFYDNGYQAKEHLHSKTAT